MGVCCLLNLAGSPLGESDSEKAEEVPISGLDINVSVNKCVPLADERTKFVRSEIHAMEICEAVFALDIINTELDFAVRLLFLLDEISQGNLNDTSFQRIVRVL